MPSRYIFLEHTPGYLPEDDAPPIFDSLRCAREYLKDEVERYCDSLCEAWGGTGDESEVFTVWWAEDLTRATVYDASKIHDLGRVFDIYEAKGAEDSEQFSPLLTLSYARTALDDPDGLPEDEYDTLHAPYSGNGDSGTYAIDRLDEVIGALHYDGGSGNSNHDEASWVAGNLARLAETFADDMREESLYEDHDDTARAEYESASCRANIAASELALAARNLSEVFGSRSANQKGE